MFFNSFFPLVLNQLFSVVKFSMEKQFSLFGFTYGSLQVQVGAEKAALLAFLSRELKK